MLPHVLKCKGCVLYLNRPITRCIFVSTEEYAQGERSQEHDSVQHANTPQERQAKGEVRNVQR